MNEYYPIYIKEYYENNKNCPKCDNNINNIENKLVCSYLAECKKCSNMSLYGENQMNNLYNIPIPRNNYTDMCTCETKYIYFNIFKCNNCIKCENCKNDMMNFELKNIKNINDTHLCSKCFNKINYNITENINY